MTSDLSRRSFLAAGAAAVSSGLSMHSGSAAEPPVRNGKPHMKLSLAAYSFNRFLPRSGRKKSGGMSLEEFVDYCAELDLDGTELTSYYFAQESTEYLLGLKQRCFRLGLDVSGTAIGNDFCLPEGEARTAQINLCKRWIDHAAVLGAPVIRIFAGRVAKGDTEEIARDRCVAGIDECLEYAATKGVFLALENHGGITATPQQLLAIVTRVRDSPWFGVNFDSGNFRTDDPYADLEKIAPYAINAQIKVAVTAGGKRQPSDFPRVIRMLKSAGYRGYVVLEYEDARPREEIPEYIRRLRELCS